MNNSVTRITDLADIYINDDPVTSNYQQLSQLNYLVFQQVLTSLVQSVGLGGDPYVVSLEHSEKLKALFHLIDHPFTLQLVLMKPRQKLPNIPRHTAAALRRRSALQKICSKGFYEHWVMTVVHWTAVKNQVVVFDITNTHTMRLDSH